MRENAGESYDIAAESLQEHFPDLVHFIHEDGSYQVSYLSLVPYLVETLQEAHARISQLEMQVFGLKPDYIPQPKMAIADSSATSLSIDTTIFIQTQLQTTPLLRDSTTPQPVTPAVRLDQNTPNLFTQNTTISFYIADTVVQADLYVYNMMGVDGFDLYHPISVLSVF